MILASYQSGPCPGRHKLGGKRAEAVTPLFMETTREISNRSNHGWLISQKVPGPSAQELYGSRAGRPGLPVPNKPYGFCGRKAP